MIKKELNDRIESIEKDLDNLEILSASEEWTSTLMERIQTERISPRRTVNIPKGIVAIGLITIANLTMIISFTVKAQNSTDERKDKLKLISKEILINPTSIKE
jgi:hypothetical protein